MTCSLTNEHKKRGVTPSLLKLAQQSSFESLIPPTPRGVARWESAWGRCPQRYENKLLTWRVRLLPLRRVVGLVCWINYSLWSLTFIVYCSPKEIFCKAKIESI
jgi:hypothetical protein